MSAPPSPADSTATDYIGAYAARIAPDPAQAALVLIDMQYATGARSGALGRKLAAQRSTVGDYRFDRIERFVVPNAQRLLAAFRAARQCVTYVTIGAQLPDASDAPAHMRAMFIDLDNHVGSREHEILDELAPRPGELVLNKTTIGAFASSGIDSALRALGRRQLYLLGVSTNMCVETTAREAADRGYAVTLIEDACGTTHADLHESTLKNFRRLFGRVCSTAEVLDELGFAR
ncbi:MAG: cysteine hydrolase [Burkholderiales bacterium]|jgi:biuret amidohydrolase|nr:cysteine hydrolase [Burkholderiales bacterium]